MLSRQASNETMAFPEEFKENFGEILKADG